MSGQEGRAVERDRPGPTGTWKIARSALQTACAGGNPIGAAGGHVRPPSARGAGHTSACLLAAVRRRSGQPPCARGAVALSRARRRRAPCLATIILFGEMMAPVHIRFVPRVGQGFVFELIGVALGRYMLFGMEMPKC